MLCRRLFVCPCIVLIVPIVTSCVVFDVQSADGVLYDGDVIVSYRHRSVGVDDCQRACKLTRNCRGFNMQWTDDVKNTGHCDLIDIKMKKPMIFQANSSFYVMCPSGMRFSWKTHRCYKLVKVRRTWSDSQRYCAGLHEQAHLMEIYDKDQQEEFEDISEILSECRFTLWGIEYVGHENKTKLGLTCQMWQSQSPHSHDTLNSTMAWLLEENYCRNLADSIMPWCYTTDPDTRWQYCDIPFCSDVVERYPADPYHPSLGLWLGARRRPGESEVVWSSSLEPVSSAYTNFEDGEPTADEDCLRAFEGLWSMASCQEVKAFVCQY